MPQAQDNNSDVTIRPQFGTALVPPNATKKDHIGEIPHSSGFLAIKVNDNQLKTINKE